MRRKGNWIGGRRKEKWNEGGKETRLTVTERLSSHVRHIE
jgi:hypothetical protein